VTAPTLAEHRLLVSVKRMPKALWMTANKRIHWRVRHRSEQTIQTIVQALAQEQNLPKGLPRVRIYVYLHFTTSHRRDPLNWANTVKPMVDGLVKYGLVADDDAHHVVGPDLRLGPKSPTQGITVVIEELS
jgi:hypothetical protein